MENENRIQPQDEGEIVEETSREGKRKLLKGLPMRNVGRYIGYVGFLVFIGLIYIWNSHVVEKQVRREGELRKEIEIAKAQYKAMHGRYSAGTQKSVVVSFADTLGLQVNTRNVYKLPRD